MKSRDTLVETWKREEQQPFTGWDFGHLDGRMVEELPPWSYAARAAELIRRAASVLDMGTGGGERLLALRDHWPAKVVVTEDYPPNVKLATERLGPLGVRVVEVSLTEADRLPFADGEFDLVLNRHSGMNHGEVARVLAPGGVFLSQQVHGLWGQDLLAAFGAQPAWPHETLAHAASRLEAAGLTIVMAEDWTGSFSFTDVGAIVYYLKVIPWLVPGFSVETHLQPLLVLQDRLECGQELVFEARKYIIEVYKERCRGDQECLTNGKRQVRSSLP
jgi:SAM-dependent methyltransferase